MGNFQGTTYGGGKRGGGTVFRLTVASAAPVFQPVSLTNGTLNLAWSTEAGGTSQGISLSWVGPQWLRGPEIRRERIFQDFTSRRGLGIYSQSTG